MLAYKSDINHNIWCKPLGLGLDLASKWLNAESMCLCWIKLLFPSDWPGPDCTGRGPGVWVWHVPQWEPGVHLQPPLQGRGGREGQYKALASRCDIFAWRIFFCKIVSWEILRFVFRTIYHSHHLDNAYSILIWVRLSLLLLQLSYLILELVLPFPSLSHKFCISHGNWNKDEMTISGGLLPS